MKQDKYISTDRNVGNWFILYELDPWSKNSNTQFTVDDCLFGVVTAKCDFIVLSQFIKILIVNKFY